MNVAESIKSIFKKPIVKVFIIFLLLTLLASTLVLHFEKNTNPSEYTSFWDSIWWALVTVFTVGYGDIRPITFGGRMVAIVVMFAGISLLSLITATISSIFVSKKIREDRGLESIKYENHIIICGWNNRAESIIETIFLLSKQKHLKMILINELPEEEVNTILDRFRKYKVKFIRG
ncbi:MAG: two pore domain potassium channel family protein, partial [Candidatus Marinimicrobia bacterium]|nr:two pore domain potassium channel family protein [Candidatus Neomarinimicrobiota bacterium]